MPKIPTFGIGEQPGSVELERVEAECAAGEPVPADVGTVGLESALGDERVGAGDLGCGLLLGAESHPVEHAAGGAAPRAVSGRREIEGAEKVGKRVVDRLGRRPGSPRRAGGRD